MTDENTVGDGELSPSITSRTCLCGDPETCKGLTAAFCFLNDPRKQFVKLPSYHRGRLNLQRQAYLECLLPHHPNVATKTPTKYIAAHHFHPALVQTHPHESIVPRTITEQEATELGVELDGTHAMFDKDFHRVFLVVPNYPLKLAKLDLLDILDSKTKCRNEKTCLCGSESCTGLTVAFTLLDDPRKEFVRVPRHHSSPQRQAKNKIRKAYLKHVISAKRQDNTSSSPLYIAAHHFDPSIVLAQHEQNGCEDDKHKAIVPQTITKQEAELFGMQVDETESMVDEFGNQVFLLVPNYPIEWSKADVDTILNQRLSESPLEESIEHHGFHLQLVTPDTSSDASLPN